MLLSSKKFEAKAKEVLQEKLEIKPKHVLLEKKTGGKGYERVALQGPSDGAGGMMLYTSGTTNRPASHQYPLYSQFTNRSFRKESSSLNPS
jgi:hypothetical protein